MKLSLILLGAVAAVPLARSSAATASFDADVITVDVAPASLPVDLGQSTVVGFTVTNTGATTTGDLIVHIDVLDPSSATSVDPEDWTPDLSQPIGPLAAGQAATVDWSIKPIAGGSFVLYATVMPEAGTSDQLAVSAGVPVEVREQRQLDPQGVVPMTIGIPTALAAALVISRRRATS